MQPVQQLDERERTKSWADLNTRWEQRTKRAAEWLQDDGVVADIGCGLMTLEAYLPSATTYLPMDLVPRDSRTLVFDINRSPIPTVSCDVAVMLGVLEYTDNIALVLRQLHQFPRCVISYNHVSLNDLLWKLGLRRKRVNWRQRYTRGNFRRLLISAGLQVIRERKIRLGERLYDVRPAVHRTGAGSSG